MEPFFFFFPHKGREKERKRRPVFFFFQATRKEKERKAAREQLQDGSDCHRRSTLSCLLSLAIMRRREVGGVILLQKACQLLIVHYLPYQRHRRSHWRRWRRTRRAEWTWRPRIDISWAGVRKATSILVSPLSPERIDFLKMAIALLQVCPSTTPIQGSRTSFGEKGGEKIFKSRDRRSHPVSPLSITNTL